MSLDIHELKNIVRTHMENQPYKATCSECGSDIDLDTDVDQDLDLSFIVYPCSCQEGK